MKTVITEKPSVALEIAKTFGIDDKLDGYFKCKDYYITWSFGHLFELAEPDFYDPAYRKWEVETLPIVPEQFEIVLSDNDNYKKQFKIIKSLVDKSDEIISATDAGREGELIFRYLYKSCDKDDNQFYRLWISSMTDEAIQNGFANLKPGKDFDNLYHSALCRHEADWIFGINLTRLYTLKYGGRKNTISVGRVQTPVLAMLVNRQKEIESFKPEPYYEIHLIYKKTIFKHTKGKFRTLDDAKKVIDEIIGNEFTITDVTEKPKNEKPPLLFDLTSLQVEANKKFGYTAEKTLELTQKLYESKLVSYPRTDSCYLTSDIKKDVPTILNKLKAIKEDEISVLNLNELKFTKRIIDDSKVSDHHAIIPTGIIPSKLDIERSNIYELIHLRFIAAFYPDCKKLSIKVEGEIEKHIFKSTGVKMLEPGWRKLYKTVEEEKEELILSQFKVGEKGMPSKIEPVEKKTTPPKNYTEATLLCAMETAGKDIDDEMLREAMKDKGLGTPATRASIIEILLKRNYVVRNKKSLIPTEKGISVIDVIENDELKSASLTGEWEAKLKNIERGNYKRADFMREIVNYTREMIDELKHKEVTRIAGVYNDSETMKNAIGTCPRCGNPVIEKDKAYGCAAYSDGCTFKIWKEIAKKKISKTQAKKLIANGKTDLIKGMTSKEGKKFDVYLKLSEEFEVVFDFPSDEERSIGDCPLCGKAIVERKTNYSCVSDREECDFIIWKEIAKKKISKTQVKKMLKTGKSDLIKGFTSREGNKFDTYLTLKDGKVIFDFPSDEDRSIGPCPVCGKPVVETKKSYVCTNRNDICSFIIWKKIAEKEISLTQAKKLLKEGKSDLIKGFRSRSGKSFDSELIIVDDRVRFPN